MNMNKVARAFRLLADAMEETAERVEDVPAADPTGVAAMAEPTPTPAPAVAHEPAQPTMTMEEFTTAMQTLGREVGPSNLHAALPAVWEKFTDGVARMSAIPPGRYAEIVEFTRKEVEKRA